MTLKRMPRNFCINILYRQPLLFSPTLVEKAIIANIGVFCIKQTPPR